jgi:Fe-S-cluster-containing hydrogenase component 2
MKILTTPRMERCIGCHSCSFACARLVHKRLSWDTAGTPVLLQNSWGPFLCEGFIPAFSRSLAAQKKNRERNLGHNTYFETY